MTTTATDPGSAVDAGRHDSTASKVPAFAPITVVVEWTNTQNERCLSERPNLDNAQGFAEGLWAGGYVSAVVTVRGGSYNERRTPAWSRH